MPRRERRIYKRNGQLLPVSCEKPGDLHAPRDDGWADPWSRADPAVHRIVPAVARRRLRPLMAIAPANRRSDEQKGSGRRELEDPKFDGQPGAEQNAEC